MGISLTEQELKIADEVAKYWRNVAFRLQKEIEGHKFLKKYHGLTDPIDRGLYEALKETL